MDAERAGPLQLAASLISSNPRGHDGLVGLRPAPLALRAVVNWIVCPSIVAVPGTGPPPPVPLGPDGLPPHANAMRTTKVRRRTRNPTQGFCMWTSVPIKNHYSGEVARSEKRLAL